MNLDPRILIVGAVAVAAYFLITKKDKQPAAAAGAGNALSNAVGSAGQGMGSLWDGLGLNAGNTAASNVGAEIFSTKPTLAPAQTAPKAVFGGTMPGASAATAGSLDAEGVYHYADGSSAYTGGGTFGYLTEDQRKGKTDAQRALAIMGY